MEGLDIVTVDDATGLISRVDGFFGDPTPLKTAQSGVPDGFRTQRISTVS